MSIKEEGDFCSADGCDGKMHYAPVENCSCHLYPPCNECVENPLICDTCLYSEAELKPSGHE